MKGLVGFFMVGAVVLAGFCVAWHEMFSVSRTPQTIVGPDNPRNQETSGKNDDPEKKDGSGNGTDADNNPGANPDEDRETPAPEAAEKTDVPDCMLARKAPELLPLFNEPGDWRLEANMIKIPKASFYFLFKGEPKISEDGRRMTLNACTVVFLPRARRVDLDGAEPLAPGAKPTLESLESRVKRALIFEVSDQIELNFSRSLMDYNRIIRENLNLSLLENGKLVGNVVVRGGDESSPKDLPFYIQTRDVVFNARQFRTTSAVSCRIGSHSVAGEGLTIDYVTPEVFEKLHRNDSVAEPETKEPIDQEEIALRERARVLSQIDEIVDDGNLGNGFSIQQVEINRITKNVSLDLRELNVSSGASDGDEAGDVDRLEVSCKGSVHFEPTSHKPGEWCVRFDDDVSANALRQNGIVCSFKGESLYLFLQDPRLEELETKFPEAYRTLRRRNPSGALSRLKTTVVRVLGGKDPISIEYKPLMTDENTPPRRYSLTAMQAYYNDQLGRFILSDQLDLDAQAPGAPAAPVSLEMEEFDLETGSPVLSRMTSSRIVLDFDRKTLKLRRLSSLGAGALSSFLRVGKGERVMMQTFWDQALLLEPASNMEDAYLLTSSGATRCNIEEMGSFYATEANFWFRLGVKKDKVAQDRYATAPTERQWSQSAEPESDAEDHDLGFLPICVAFTTNVMIETPNGKMTVADRAEVRFSDQSGTDQARPAPSLALNTSASSGNSGSSKGSALNASLVDEKDQFDLKCRNLEAWCELSPRAPSDAEDGDAKKTALRLVSVVLNDGVEFVERDAAGTEKARLLADSVTVEDPLTSAMRILFHSDGGTAQFRANELALLGKDVLIDVGRNSFQVVGPGDVTIRPAKKEEGAAANSGAEQGTSVAAAADALTEPVSVSWSKAMLFDGQTMSFQADERSDVLLKSTDATIYCEETRLSLSKSVNFLDLRFDGESAPDVEYVECVSSDIRKPVRLSFNAREKGADPQSSDYAGYYRMLCKSVRVDVTAGTFAINNQGEFVATFLSEKGVSDLGATAASSVDGAKGQESPQPQTSTAPEKKWVRVDARFNGASGSFREGFAEIDDDVKALICDVDGPLSKVALDDVSSWPESAAIFHCRKAVYRAAGGGKEMKNDVELEASGDVSFRMFDYSGTCETLGYAASKSLVTLSGTGNAPATIDRQEYSGAPRVKVAEFSTGRIHLDTKRFEAEDAMVDVGLDESWNSRKKDEKEK